jgi:hypothetical protein
VTRFPQLPVMGHVPKKRKVDLSKVLTLAQIYEILDSPFVSDLFYHPQWDCDYALGQLRKEFTKAAVER